METLFQPEVTGHNPYEGMTKKQIRKLEASDRRFHKTLDRLEAYINSWPTKIKNYIDKHPLQRKNTQFFAERALLDTDVIHRVFKREWQVTIQAYQLQKRMEAAAAMLQEGKLSEKRIASRCGYSTVNNFRRAFKKVFKLTPTQYLQTLQSNGRKQVK